MSFVLGDAEHKAAVRYCFVLVRKEDEFCEKLEKLGFYIADEGLAVDTFYCASSFLRHITPAHIFNLDCFIEDFNYMQDFEEFYEKYFTKKEF